MKRATAATCAVPLAAVAPGAAQAAPPPRRSRRVTPESGRHVADLRILGTDECRGKGNGHTGRHGVDGRRVHWRSGPLGRIFDGGRLSRGQHETLIDLFTGSGPGGRDDIHCRRGHRATP